MSWRVPGGSNKLLDIMQCNCWVFGHVVFVLFCFTTLAIGLLIDLPIRPVWITSAYWPQCGAPIGHHQMLHVHAHTHAQAIQSGYLHLVPT